MAKNPNKKEAPTNIWAFLQAAPFLNKPSKQMANKLAQRFGIKEERLFVLIELSKMNGATCFN